MAINLKQYTGSTITPTDDALLYDFIMSEQSGIFEGCEVTHLGANQLQISDGRGLIRGRVFTVSQQTILANVSPSGSVKGRLIVKVDLGNGEAPISLVTQAASVLPELTQQDINRDGTVFELPLATYDVTEVVISGLVSATKKVSEGMTAEKILEKLKTVDGPGSGLDADLLDGKQADDFAPKEHTHTASQVTSGTLPSGVNISANQVTPGTLPTGVKASTASDYTTARLRNIKAGTSDLTAGSSSLANGEIYIVYE